MLIVLNHKMNFTKEEAISYEKVINQKSYHDELVICPSMGYLSLFQGKNYRLGSQNVSQYEQGSHTGEISSTQLRSLGVSYCLVGHSERRKEYFEDSLSLNQKIKWLLKSNITPILCLGETLEERQSNLTEDILKKDMTMSLANLSHQELEKIIIAYEPIWAIGTGSVPTNEMIENTVKWIKHFWCENYQVQPKVLYGGSVNKQNYLTLKTIPNIDGFLIGSLGLQAETIQTLLEQ